MFTSRQTGRVASVVAASLLVVGLTAATPVGPEVATSNALPHVGGEVSIASLALQHGPMLVLEDSVILRETGEHYVGEPAGLLLSEDGSFFVADRFSNGVLHFDSNGEFRNVFGRAGQGPGEFAYIGITGFVARGTLGFLDMRPPGIELFDVETGRHRGTVEIEQGTLPMSFSVRDDTLWIGGVDTDAWSAVGMATIRDVVSESTDVVISLDRIPVARPYVENRRVLGTFPYTGIDVGADDLMVGFGVSPFILRTNRAGAVLDSLVFPVLRRRGLPAEGELGAINPGDVSLPDLIGSLSTLGAVSRDETGIVYAVHQDFDAGEARVGGGFDARATFFVSSIGADGSEACPDTFLPTSDLGVAKLALSGNQMFVLDQRLADGGQTARTVIRRFTINPLECTGTIARPARP